MTKSKDCSHSPVCETCRLPMLKCDCDHDPDCMCERCFEHDDDCQCSACAEGRHCMAERLFDEQVALGYT